MRTISARSQGMMATTEGTLIEQGNPMRSLLRIARPSLADPYAAAAVAAPVDLIVIDAPDWVAERSTPIDDPTPGAVEERG